MLYDGNKLRIDSGLEYLRTISERESRRRTFENTRSSVELIILRRVTVKITATNRTAKARREAEITLYG